MIIGELSALGAAFTWAVASILFTQLGSRVHVMGIGMARGVIASLFFFAMLPFTEGLDALAGVELDTFLGLGLAVLLTLGAGDTSFLAACRRIGVSRAMPLSMTSPLFTMVLAAAFLGERPTLLALAGTALIIGGVYLLSMRLRGAAVPEPPADARGVALALGSSIFSAVGAVLLTPYTHRVGAVVGNCIRQPLAALLFLGLMPKPEGFRQFRRLSASEWLVLLIGALWAVVWALSSIWWPCARPARPSPRC